MVSDSITTPIASGVKYVGKKKRANNRAAKLKQNKLDARREQWLSQGGLKNKGGKGQQAGAREPVGAPLPREKERGNGLIESTNVSAIQHDFDLDSLVNSPTGSSVLGGTDSGTNFSGSSSSSSSSSGGCCSGSVTEEERDDDNHSCFDDWETAADALNAREEKQGDDDGPGLEQEMVASEHEPAVESHASLCNLGSDALHMTQECFGVETQCLPPQRSKAWMPDDAYRPQTLPNLSKHLSFPNNTKRVYGQGVVQWDHANGGGVNAPSSCPVCTEDLDLTDASFLPCSCGFQVCLFCYKKMLELDGRCPNCRKIYNCDPVEVETSVHGGNQLTIRLGRSCSLIERS